MEAYWFRDFTKEQRDKLAESGAAMPDGSYPIANSKDLENAVRAYGHNPTPAVKAHIVKRAKALGKTDELPADWEGSTKQASDPGVEDVHVPGVPQPASKKNDNGPSPHFLKQLYKLMREKVGTMMSESDFNTAVKRAAGHSGGKTKAERLKAAMEAIKSMSDQHIVEIFNDYMITSSEEAFYKVPFSFSDEDAVELGTPSEVEMSFTPVSASENLLDICADGKQYCLFNELQQFSTPPNRIPLLPKPGTYKHDKYGSVRITKERNQRFTDNINNGVYQKNLPIDSEHELDLSGAFGYIKKASMNADGSVDGTDIEWTDRGKKAFAGNRFKYFSPKWWDAWTDPMTEQKFKDVVIGGALTTRPFFKEKALKPLIASEHVILSDGNVNGNSSIPTGAKKMATTEQQIKEARTLVAAAEAKAMSEALEGKTDEDIEKAKALVASEDARIAAEKSAKDPDGDGDDDTSASGDSDNSHFDDKGNKKPGMFDKDGKPLATKQASAKKGEPEEAKEATEMTKEFSDRLNAAEAEARSFKEKLETAEKEAKRANDRADAQEKANRLMRFTSMVKGWPGQAQQNIELLEHFATTCGEDSKEFKAFVDVQQASAKQIDEAGLFSEIGSSSAVEPDSALGELNTKAAALRASDPKLTQAQAFSDACAQNPELYDRHRREQRRQFN